MVCPVCISSAIAANIPVISAAVGGVVAAKISMAPKPKPAPKPQKPEVRDPKKLFLSSRRIKKIE